MVKTILLTGGADGFGLESAKILVSQGHHVLLHGRNPTKLVEAAKTYGCVSESGTVAWPRWTCDYCAEYKLVPGYQGGEIRGRHGRW